MHYDDGEICSKMDRIVAEFFNAGLDGWIGYIGTLVSDGQDRHEIVFDSQCAELTGKTKSFSFLAWCIATGAGVHCTGSGVSHLVDSFMRSYVLCDFEIEHVSPKHHACRSTFSTHRLRKTTFNDRSSQRPSWTKTSRFSISVNLLAI